MQNMSTFVLLWWFLNVLFTLCTSTSAGWRGRIKQRINELNTQGFCHQEAVYKVIEECPKQQKTKAFTWGNVAAVGLNMVQCDYRKQTLQIEDLEGIKQELEEKLKHEMEMREMETAILLEKIKDLQQEVATMKHHIEQLNIDRNLKDERVKMLKDEITTLKLLSELDSEVNKNIALKLQPHQDKEDSSALKGDL